MTYQTKITKKGQITIPKKIREALDLDESQKMAVELEKNKKEVKLKPYRDFLEVAKRIKVENKEDPIKSREKMEENYERE